MIPRRIRMIAPIIGGIAMLRCLGLATTRAMTTINTISDTVKSICN
jgi:hypothetical protein